MSDSAYLAFKKDLECALDKGILTETAPDFGGSFIQSQYLCNRCGSCWQLSVPDQAFRGGWEKVQCS